MFLRTRFFLTALSFFVVFSFEPSSVFSQTAKDKPKILIMNSYHPGFPWTESIMEGIRDRLIEENSKIDISVEYLDTKQYDPLHLFPLLEALYAEKYKNQQFEVIIATDNNAIDFIFAYRNSIFPGVPVVFCGINDFHPSLLEGKTGITGVVEDYKMKETFDLALHLHPNTKHIAVISDTTPTDAANRSRLERIKPGYRGCIRFIDLIGLPAPRLIAAVQQLPENTAILFLNYYRDVEGGVYTLKEGISLLSENCGFPLYSMWKDKIEAGALGGIITSGKLQGENAADLALRIISGTAPDDLPVLTESPTVPMFNYDSLHRYGVARSELPKNSIVLNEPNTFFYKHRGLIIQTLVLIGILLVIIFILWLNIGRRKRAEDRLRRLLEEKDFLMKELNHRVKNNLAIVSSLISLKDSALGPDVDLSDFKSQIDAIQIVHEILYKSNDITSIEIKEYFQDLLNTIFSSFTTRPVAIETNLEEQNIPTKIAIPIGLIVNELATNAIKYGFTDGESAKFVLDFSRNEAEKKYVLTISNTGRPFPENIDLDNPQTLGVRLVSALVNQIKGSIALQRKPYPVFTITFPIKPEG